VSDTDKTRQLARELHDTRETIDQVRKLLDDLIAACQSPAIDTLTVKPGVHIILTKLATQVTTLDGSLRQLSTRDTAGDQ
jgi:hypothetical protein